MNHTYHVLLATIYLDIFSDMIEEIDLDKLTNIEIPEEFVRHKRDNKLRYKIETKLENSNIHHIIPLHMGGTNDPSNLIELTVEQHIEAHRLLYEKYGYKEDLYAYNIMTNQFDISGLTRKDLAAIGYRIFLDNPRKVKAQRDKIRKWNLGKKYGEETKKKHSERLKREYAEGKGKPISHYVDKEWYIQHAKNNVEATAEGRRNSEIWRDSVTSDEYRKRQSELFKGRDITWGEEISKAKKGKVLYNSKMVDIEGVKYNSMAILSEQMGFKKHAIAKYVEVHKLELDGDCYYIKQTYDEVIEDISSRLKLPYLVDGIMFSSLSKVANHFKVSENLIKTFERTNVNNEYFTLKIDYNRIEKAKLRKNYTK